MRHLRFSVFLCALLSAFFIVAAYGQTTVTGTTDAGAHYQIVMPENWNGDLVIFNRGSSGFANPPGLGPLKDLQLFEGYAVAATSFRQPGGGAASLTVKQDLQALMGVFKENFGHPNQIILYGRSWGGWATATAVELANLGNVVGALPMCGGLAGNKVFNDVMLDLRLTYDVVCSEIPEAYIPGGAEGLPKDSPPTWPEITAAMNACTGIFLPPFARTPEQAENLARILNEFQIPEGFFVIDMWFATISMSGLVHDVSNGKIAATNLGVSYNDPSIDATIERVAAHPGIRNRLDKNYTPTGDVGDVRIISINTDLDIISWIDNVSVYSGIVPASNLTPLVVVESAPAHCGFTEAELVASWEELRAWVAGGSQPSASEVQNTCVGLAMGPCRIDPGFVLPDPNLRLRPR